MTFKLTCGQITALLQKCVLPCDLTCNNVQYKYNHIINGLNCFTGDIGTCGESGKNGPKGDKGEPGKIPF